MRETRYKEDLMQKAPYDAFAKDWDKTRQVPWPEFEEVTKVLHPHDRLLDLGCGNGRLRQYLGEDILRAGNYFGFDLSREQIAIAKENHEKDHFFIGDMGQELPFGSENFEVVAAFASFHHLLSRTEQETCFSELKRILKPNGILILTTWKLPRKFWLQNVLRLRWYNWLIPFGKEKYPRFYRKTSLRLLRKLCRKHGFELIKSELSRGRNYLIIAQKI